MAYSAPYPSSQRSSGRHTTHPCLHIRNAADAQVVFEAVRLNILPMIRRRLGPTERDMLRSGEIFVWEETDQKGGLERWTDGRRWSQSRMREPFLYYEEKEPITKEEKEAKAARRASRNTDPSSPIPIPSRRQDRPSKTDGLTKQTYSIYVNLGNVSRKWHLVAYFSGSDYARLPVIEDYDYLRHIRVPKSIYVSSKGLQMNSDSYIDDEDDYSLSSSPQSPTLYKPAHVSPTIYHQPHRSLYPAHEHSGYPTAHSAAGATYSSSGSNAAETYLSGYSYPNHSKYGPSKSSENKAYVPLTSEDRRALGAFRVAL